MWDNPVAYSKSQITAAKLDLNQTLSNATDNIIFLLLTISDNPEYGC